MSVTSAIDPGTLLPSAGAPPFVRRAERGFLFARRAERFEQLATGHAAEPFLRFLAAVSRAQQAALDACPPVPLPSAAELAVCREHRLPPLGAHNWRRHGWWREALRDICAAVRESAPPETRAIIERLAGLDAAALETQATALLGGDHTRLDRASAPFVGAALQVYWAHLAGSLEPGDIDRIEPATLCPACGSLPQGSMVRIGGEHGLRYLACSLCSTEWHYVRIKCAHCESTKGIGYYHVESGSAAIRAEACEECRSYVKIFYMEKDPAVDAMADDLASLALDLLMDEAGYTHAGANLLFIPGEAANRPSMACGPRRDPIGDDAPPPGQ